MDKILNDLVQKFAKNNWHKWQFMLIILTLYNICIFKFLHSENIELQYVLIFNGISSFLILLIWYKYFKLPTTPSGKVGFVLSVYCPDEDKNNCIQNDFLRSLKKIIKNNDLENKFHFIEIPSYISKETVDINSANNLLDKTKSQFIVYGIVQYRDSKDKKYYFLELDGIVRHQPLSKENHKGLSVEFSELFPNNLKIDAENDVFSFRFTSEWIEFVSKYIIAIASFCSGNIDHAESLYKELNSRDNVLNSEFNIFKTIKQRLPKRLAEVNLERAKVCFEAWKNNKSEESLQQFSQYLSMIGNELGEKNYGLILIKAIERFLTKRDVNKSIKMLKDCKKVKDPVWKMNLAFLYAYKKNMSAAIRYYKECLKKELHADTLAQIEEFICWVIDNEKAFHLYYCLGFFNWKFKGDKLQASKDFAEFLNKCPSDKFVNEFKFANDWLKEIECEST